MVTLTPEQKAKYERETLERIDAKVRSLQDRKAYKNADDDLKRHMIEGIIRKQRAQEAAEMKKEMLSGKPAPQGTPSDKPKIPSLRPAPRKVAPKRPAYQSPY